MRSSHLKNIILIYCVILFAGAVVGSIVSKNTTIASDFSAEAVEPEISPIPLETAEIEEPEATPQATPTPVVLVGATECWKQMVDEMDFNWEEISDKSCLLFKKPEASETAEVECSITGEDGPVVELTLENCEYTEFYYSSIERRANGHYYNAQPAATYAGATKENTEVTSGEAANAADTSTSVSDTLSDPLRKLSSTIVKEKDGSYTITIEFTLDKSYSYKLYETECFYVLTLSKGTNQ